MIPHIAAIAYRRQDQEEDDDGDDDDDDDDDEEEEAEEGSQVGPFGPLRAAPPNPRAPRGRP